MPNLNYAEQWSPELLEKEETAKANDSKQTTEETKEDK